jgi:hypothetical protein
MGVAMDLAWCDALIAPAKQVAGEVAAGPQRGTAARALQQLAKCVGTAGRCDDARALWSLSNKVDAANKHKQPDLGPRCTAASAELAATETYVDAAPLPTSLTAAMRARDLAACRKHLAAPLPNVAPGHLHSIERQLAHCEMITGNCAAGTARLQRIGPNGPGRPVSPSIHAAWLQSQVSTYCPIAGSLDERVAQVWAQIDGFTTRDSGNVAWCDAIIPAARKLAGEVATAAHRTRTVRSLRRLAECVARAGRCDQGRELWALSVQVDGGTPSTPALGAACP